MTKPCYICLEPYTPKHDQQKTCGMERCKKLWRSISILRCERASGHVPRELNKGGAGQHRRHKINA